jgi:hypothetical protein
LNIIVHNKSLKTTRSWIYYIIIYMSTLPSVERNENNIAERIQSFMCI